MPADPALIGWIEEALAPLGRVSSRAMMGGAALYLDGTIFALVARDELWFKADGESDAAWDAAGCERFSYQMPDRLAVMNYRRAPDDAYDDADALRHWAALGLAAGLRAPPKKSRARVSRRPAR